MINFHLSNYPQFAATLQAYAMESNKSFRDVVNSALLGVLYKALQYTKKADAARIRALESDPNWPKYVAARIRDTAGGIKVRGTLGKRAFARLTAGEIIYRGRKSKTKIGKSFKSQIWQTGRSMELRKTRGRVRFAANITGKYTKEEAKLVSKRIIKGKLRSISFIKSGWLPGIKKLYPLVVSKGRYSEAMRGMSESARAQQRGLQKGDAWPAALNTQRTEALAELRSMNPVKFSKPSMAIMTTAVEGANQGLAAERTIIMGKLMEMLKAGIRKYGVKPP